MSQDLDPEVPIITEYTRKMGIPDDILRKLMALRKWDLEHGGPIPFKWPTRLRTILPDGETLRVREFQKQGIHHLARMNRFILGDAVGLGKTLSGIAATTWIADRVPRLKIIVVTTKTLGPQWQGEYNRFTTFRTELLSDAYDGDKLHEARKGHLIDFLKNDDADVLVCKYTALVGKRKKLDTEYDEDGFPVVGGRERMSQEIRDFLSILKPYGKDVILVLDEGQKFKTFMGALNMMVAEFQQRISRVWILTATAMQNDLREFYSMALAVNIAPHGNMTEFEEKFCVFKLVPIGKGRKVRKLEGYRNVKEFKAGMRPFFIGRSQRQVKEKLPSIVTQIHAIEPSKEQLKLLLEDIPNGTFKLPPSFKKVAGEWVEKERDIDNEMTQLSVYQLVANHPCLLDPTNKKEFLTKSLSPKEEFLLDMLDGDFRGEKFLTFTKFRSWIDRLEGITKAGHFTERKFLRITGAETPAQREHNKQLFQDPKSGYDFMMINSAAIEGVNLQQAAHLATLDLPWSWGNLLQLLGRIMRIGSPHSMCTFHALTMKGTIDEYAIETLKGKKGVFEQVLGQSHSAGIFDDGLSIDLSSGMEQVGSDEDFRSMLKAHVKLSSMKDFLNGDYLEDVKKEGDAYKMSFESGPKVKRKVSRRSSEEDVMADIYSRWG